MDLQPIKTPPTPEEVAAVTSVLGPPGEDRGPQGLAAAEARRHLLLPVLHALQARVGWISPGGLGEACRRLHVPPAEGYGVASFYALFSMAPRAPRVVHVCDDVVCAARGAGAVCDALESKLGPAGAGEGATWLRSPCLGLCEQPVAAMLTAAGDQPEEATWSAHGATPTNVADGLAAVVRGRAPPARVEATVQQPPEGLRLLRRVGRVDPTSLDAYRASGGYTALEKALRIGDAAVIAEVTASRLMGRGGAAFPTGRKWAAVAAQPAQPHWLVCNADESEPGTFKDRVLMEGDPFTLVEALTIAGLATGCARGIIYLRAEYPLAAARVQGAIDKAKAAGLLGGNVAGSGRAFDLELRRGAGAYICGEETALFASIEGFRGEPRSKPPFPVEVGLFGKPTLINNVETMANVPDIVLQGGAAFAEVGTPQSTGTRLFCLSGHVERPGIYEVPFGTTLRALLDLAGGVAGGRAARAVLLGGAAGTFLTPEEIDVPLTFEDTRRIGATLGSGVVVVFDDTTALLPVLQRIAGFFRDESCGQCVPCRVGTVRQEELLARVANRRPHGGIAAERETYRELSQCMRDASICGLGQTASSAVESALQRFDHLWGGA
jgi:NADH-quinone oxidoreductase subunit F